MTIIYPDKMYVLSDILQALHDCIADQFDEEIDVSLHILSEKPIGEIFKNSVIMQKELGGSLELEGRSTVLKNSYATIAIVAAEMEGVA